jgi:hypothetical protein
MFTPPFTQAHTHTRAHACTHVHTHARTHTHTTQLHTNTCRGSEADEIQRDGAQQGRDGGEALAAED